MDHNRKLGRTERVSLSRQVRTAIGKLTVSDCSCVGCAAGGRVPVVPAGDSTNGDGSAAAARRSVCNTLVIQLNGGNETVATALAATTAARAHRRHPPLNMNSMHPHRQLADPSIATVDEAACSSKEYAGEIKLDGGTSAEVCSGWLTSRRFNVTQPTQPTCPPVAHPRCPRPRPLATPRPFGMRVASAAGGPHSAASEPPRYPRVPGGVLLVMGWFPGRFWAL